MLTLDDKFRKQDPAYLGARLAKYIQAGDYTHSEVLGYIKYGADLSAMTDGFSCLGQAIIKKDIPLIELLISHKANVDQVGGFRRTLLMLGSAPDITKILIDAGANVNAVDINGFSCIHCCVSFGDFTSIPLLIEHGCTMLNVPDHAGETPLYYAGTRHKLDAAEYLLDLPGIDPRPQRDSGKDIKDYLKKNNAHPRSADLLQKIYALEERLDQEDLARTEGAVQRKRQEIVNIVMQPTSVKKRYPIRPMKR